MGAAAERETGLLEAALAYARRGWPVFPLWWPLPGGRCACGDRECRDVGKHPLGLAGMAPHGLHDATTDEATIRGWWRRRPPANVGLATGPRSGLVALDVDPRHAGDETLRGLEREHGALPATVEAMSGGGGRHLLFAHPRRPVRSQSDLWPGVDVKADGGYLVAPPSLHASGARYAWDLGRHPEDTPLAELPPWLLWRVRTTVEVTGPAPEIGAEIAPGRRNAELTSLAGSMRRRGMAEGEIAAALVAVDEGRCRPPLGAAEVRAIARSVCRYAPAEVPDDVRGDPLPESPGKRDGRRPFGELALSAPALIERYVLSPEPKWLVPGYVPAVGLTLLSGRPKRGKSVLAESLAVAVAGGGRWLGHRLEAAPAVIVQVDQGWRTTAERLQLWGAAALPRLTVIAERGMQLAGIAGFEEGLAALGPRLVVLDAAAVLLAVRSEYDNQEVALACARLTALCERLRCALLLVHHNRKAETAEDALVSVRGGTSWTGAADAILELHGKEGGPVQLRATLRSAKDPERLALALDEESVTFVVQGTVAEVREHDERRAVYAALEGLGEGATTEAVAAVLGLTREAARQRLQALLGRGMVSAGPGASPPGGGRPPRVWRRGQGSFASSASTPGELQNLQNSDGQEGHPSGPGPLGTPQEEVF